MNNFSDLDVDELKLYESTLSRLYKSAEFNVSTIKPSEWASLKRVMPNNSSVAGQFDWKNAPYAREILDCGAPDHPARTIVVMKGVQIGLSTSMIQNLIGYMIDENPNNIMLLVGHEDLIKDSVERIDDVIDGSGIRDKLHSKKGGARKTKSGDTDKKKEFDGGYLSIGISNHKTLRQVSIQTMIVDDFDGMRSSSISAGDTMSMIEARLTAFRTKKKLYCISTPELEETSNVEPVYLQGDQRRYNIPCPCCNELIILEWKIQSELDSNEMAGITWQTTPNGKLIDGSVGYTCQKCGEFFDDSLKSEWLLEEGYGGSAKWIPTVEPIDPENYSYQISALYAPIYMNNWDYYVRKYIEANPFGGVRNESKWQTFKNLYLGLTYKPTGVSISANKLQKNIRSYDIMTVPEKQSIADGNGKIVMITCGSDLGGMDDSKRDFTRDDARLDWEIVAYAESGATYSINHGSIGTFINRDNNPKEREWSSAKHGVKNSIWPEFEKLISTKLVNDNTGKKMGIFMTAVDSGYLASYVYTFVDNSNQNVISVKGDEDGKQDVKDKDSKTYKLSVKKRNLYLIKSNLTKDNLSSDMNLNWDKDNADVQPFGFMNFPEPSEGKYLFGNYFSHFEAEHKIIDTKSQKYTWVKKTAQHQNHIFDCRLYANVVRDILMDQIFKQNKIKNGTWADYVYLMQKYV